MGRWIVATVAMALLICLAQAQAAWLPESFQMLPIGNNPSPAEDHRENNCAACEAHIQEPNSEAFWVRLTTDPVAFFTAVLSLFTLVLGGSTILLWLETRSASRINERNLIRLERPQVFMDVGNPGLREAQSRLEFTEHHFRFAVMNYGRGVALITEFVPAIKVHKKGEFPAFIGSDDRSDPAYRELPTGCVSIIDLPYSEGINLREYLDFDRMHRASAADEMHVFFIGWVRYLDAFGNRYISGFCKAFDPIGQRFVTRGDTKYNYARKDK